MKFPTILQNFILPTTLKEHLMQLEEVCIKSPELFLFQWHPIPWTMNATSVSLPTPQPALTWTVSLLDLDIRSWILDTFLYFFLSFESTLQFIAGLMVHVLSICHSLKICRTVSTRGLSLPRTVKSYVSLWQFASFKASIYAHLVDLLIQSF